MTHGFAIRTVLPTAMLFVSVATSFTPARYQSGSPPAIDVRAAGGGEVFFELGVGASGAVISAAPLRTTPPFVDEVAAALAGWTFEPAQDADQGAVASKVFVAAVFRPPTVNTPTFGEPPKDAGTPSDEIPFPTRSVAPAYPANAMGDGTVLLECRISAAGRIVGTKVLQSSGAFDSPALDAIRRWTFRPARRDGQPVEAYAYVSMAFRQPVV